MRTLGLVVLSLALNTDVVFSQTAYGPFAWLRTIDGSGTDAAKAVAVDSQDNLYIVGITASSDLPVTQGVLQTAFGGGACFAGSSTTRSCYDLFVAKFSPSGDPLWLTYLGGSSDESAGGIAVQPDGSIVVAGDTASGDFPWTDAGDRMSGRASFLASISADGKRLVWTRRLASSSPSLAVDGAGRIWVAGTVTPDTVIPLLHPFQAEQRFAYVYKRRTAGGLWSASFVNRKAQAVGVDPSNPLSVYAGGTGAIWRSSDGGETFAASAIDGAAQVNSLAVDVNAPSRVYAATTAGLWRSTDSGGSWTQADSRLKYVVSVVTHPAAPGVVYAGARDGVYKSTDGGATWSPTSLVNSSIPPAPGTFIETLAFDPADANVLYAGTEGGLMRTSNGGNGWTRIDLPPDDEWISALAIDPADPRTIYASTYVGRGTWKSSDRGQTWTRSSVGLVLAFAITPDGVYATTAKGVYVTRDGGATWQVVGDLPGGTGLAAVGSYLYSASVAGASDAYVMKFSADGTLLFSSYFGGAGADTATSLTIDSSGNALLGGITSSPDLPVSPDAAQNRKAGGSDFFVARIAADGQRVMSSTYLGGTDDESGLRIASRPNGETYLAGSSLSADLFAKHGFGPMGMDDEVVAVLDGNLATVLRNGRVGGGSSDSLQAFAVTPAGDAVIGGYTLSSDYPDSSGDPCAFDAATLTGLDAAGAMAYSACIAGSSSAFEALAVTSAGDLVVAGRTGANDFPGMKQRVRSDAAVVGLIRTGGWNPVVSDSGVVNAGSYQETASPGSVISIFGSRLATAEGAASGTPLPRQLEGVTVLINGAAVPLFYVGPWQINAQIPFDTPVGTATLAVEVEGRRSATVPLAVTLASPGIFFTADKDHAIAQNLPDWSLNSPASAALPGQYVIVYLTGLGPVDNPVIAGAAVPPAPLARAVASVAAMVGGQPAEVAFAGLTPGFVGLGQINIKIPNVPSGDQSLELTVGGLKGNTTYLSVKAN
jgi:uncharacterized protein (TIGR03437 family)